MRKAIVAEPGLTGDGNTGHILSNAVKLLSAADEKEYEKIVFAGQGYCGQSEVNQIQITPVFHSEQNTVRQKRFRNSFIKKMIRKTDLSGLFHVMAMQKDSPIQYDPVMYQDTVHMIETYRINKDDIIFWASLNLSDLTAVCRAFKDCFGYEGPVVKCCVWEPLEQAGVSGFENRRRKAYLKKRFLHESEFIKQGKIQFFSDSEKRNEQYNQLLGEHIFSILPMISSMHTQVHRKLEKKNRYIGFLGGLRENKGGYHLYGLIKKILAACPDNVKIAVQTYVNPRDAQYASLKKEADKIARIKSSRILVLPEPLEPDQYEKIFHKCDMIVLPYDRQVYRIFTSGPFSEAVSGRKIVIAPELTWMAGIIQKGNTDYYRNILSKVTYRTVRLHKKGRIQADGTKNSVIFSVRGNRSGLWTYYITIKEYNRYQRKIFRHQYRFELCGFETIIFAHILKPACRMLTAESDMEEIDAAVTKKQVRLGGIGVTYDSISGIPACINQICENPAGFFTGLDCFSREWSHYNGPEKAAEIIYG